MVSKFKQMWIWVKEFFRRCPIRKQFTKDDPPFMIIGHRGAPYKEPENTLPSFQLALDEGANGIELDLSMTKDNQVVLWHDWDPNNTVALLREAGFEPWVRYKPHPPSIFSEYRKPVDQLTLDEIRNNYGYKKRKGKLHLVTQAHIPTLEEFFQWAAGKEQLLFVFFDIKAPADQTSCAVEMLNLLKIFQQKYNTGFEVIIETFHTECLFEMKKAHPDFHYSFDTEPPAGFVLEPEEYSAINVALKYENEYAIGFRPRKVTFANWTTFRRILQIDRKKIKQMRKKGDCSRKLIGATVSKRKELRCLVRLGVDGIQTDFPGRLRKIAQRHKRTVAAPELENKIAV